ncbi:zinc-binding dehydrogenase [Streptomyces sp. NPDC018031]|uniref:zinc-binding dehydrogenase n=1 Tax=Streptomyces sp. NPDC018031 TaxID=3365033 RepID=UPI00378C2C72
MHTAAQFAQLVDAARHGRVRPLVHHRYPLSRPHTAQEEFGKREHVGKIVIDPALRPGRPRTCPPRPRGGRHYLPRPRRTSVSGRA